MAMGACPRKPSCTGIQCVKETYRHTRQKPVILPTKEGVAALGVQLATSRLIQLAIKGQACIPHQGQKALIPLVKERLGVLTCKIPLAQVSKV
jgi:hypothetical protein